MKQYVALLTVLQYIEIYWIVTPVLWYISYRPILSQTALQFTMLNQTHYTRSIIHRLHVTSHLQQIATTATSCKSFCDSDDDTEQVRLSENSAGQSTSTRLLIVSTKLLHSINEKQVFLKVMVILLHFYSSIQVWKLRRDSPCGFTSCSNFRSAKTEKSQKFRVYLATSFYTTSRSLFDD